MDWSLGHYERTAAALLPVAEVVVAAADPSDGEHVVDLGCGTGNAALLSAERGARVTGVDPAPRLLGVARERAHERELDIAFSAGEAAALPLTDASADILLSVFGVIFAPDAHAAAAEISRVITPDGRVVLSAWLPTGALLEAMRIRREAIGGGSTTPPQGGRPFDWHDAESLTGLFGPHGFSVSLQEHSLEFKAASPESFLDGELGDHPMWIAARTALAAPELDATRDRVLEVFDDANERPEAFCITSRYVVVTATRHGR